MAALQLTLPDRSSAPPAWLALSSGIAAAVLAAAAVICGRQTGQHMPLVAGDTAIVYLHVPAAWLSLLLYAAAAGCAAATLALPDRMPALLLHALAPVGLGAALLALATGLASQRASGAWWGWDARLVCELVLLLLFAAALALRSGLDGEHHAERADHAVALLVLVGALNIPILYLSANWWHTVHARAAASVGGTPSAVAAMVLMTLAFCLAAVALVLARLQALAREQEATGRLLALAGSEDTARAADNGSRHDR